MCEPACYSMKIQNYQHNYRSLMFLCITYKLTKYSEYFHKIIQILLIFLTFETSNVHNN